MSKLVTVILYILVIICIAIIGVSVLMIGIDIGNNNQCSGGGYSDIPSPIDVVLPMPVDYPVTASFRIEGAEIGLTLYSSGTIVARSEDFSETEKFREIRKAHNFRKYRINTDDGYDLTLHRGGLATLEYYEDGYSKTLAGRWY